MTIQEVLDSLPNGLHDAELHSIEIDYVARTANLDVDVWVGDMSQQDAAREAYRHAKVTLSGLVYFVVEPPDSRYPFDQPKPLRIDVGIDKLAPESLRGCFVAAAVTGRGFCILDLRNRLEFFHSRCRNTGDFGIIVAMVNLRRHPTNRWTGAAGARSASSVVR